MPTYVYKFVETGETIEVQQGFHDDALTEATHPVTGAVLAVKKVFQPVGISFKGGGFYKTDSRSSSKSASSSNGTASGDTGSSTSESSTSGTTSTSDSSASSPSGAPSGPSAPSAPSPAPSSTGTAAS